MPEIPTASEEPRPAEQPSAPQPTDADRENKRIRRAIAERMEAAWVACAAWALKAFGAGWSPAYRHFLVSKEEEDLRRREGGTLRAAATVFTVKNDAGEKRHFTVSEDGQVRECAGYEEGLGPMLLEPDMGRTMEVRGQQVHPHRYSLCFAPYVLYEPKSAEQLAALRQSRERQRAEREQARWKAENPLFAWAGIRPEA